MVVALPITPTFADVSSGGLGPQTQIDDSHIQLAQANLPPIGSVDDYMREGNEDSGGASAGASPQYYQPQGAPPPGFYPQGVPRQDWNPGYADPTAERNALVGAAVVGAVAVGMWAWQQHEIRQAQKRARKRYYSHQRAYD